MQLQIEVSQEKLIFQRDCTICVAKTKALISAADLRFFVFAKIRFSHDLAQLLFPQNVV